MLWIRSLAFLVLLLSSVAADTVPAQWYRLLYYEKDGKDITSLVKDPRFFITPSGRYDPYKEYQAALEKTVQQDVVFKTQFPLRYKYLAQQHQLPYEPLVSVSPAITGLTLAYPHQYFANPASMFGHVFLILKSEHGVLDSGLFHFLADSHGASPLAYIPAGLTGKFQGKFITEPYYTRIKQYTYEQDRDISFFDLVLTASQIEDMQFHAKELAYAQFDYYFFNRNCVTFINKFLEVVYAKQLAKKRLFEFPSHLINPLIKQGIVVKQTNRKASTKQFVTHYNALQRHEKKQVKALLYARKPIADRDMSLRSYRAFLTLSDYVINNTPSYAPHIRAHRIQALQRLAQDNQPYSREPLVEQTTLQPMTYRAFNVAYRNNGMYALSYTPVSFSTVIVDVTQDMRRIHAFGWGVALKKKQRPLLSLSLVNIMSLVPYVSLLESNSWSLASTFYYRNRLTSDMRFRYGRSWVISPYTLASVMGGVTGSGLNVLEFKERAAWFIEPTAEVAVRHVVFKDTMHVQLASVWRYNQLWGRGAMVYKHDRIVYEVAIDKHRDTAIELKCTVQF